VVQVRATERAAAIAQQQMQELADWLYDTNKIDNKPDVAKWMSVGFIPKS